MLADIYALQPGSDDVYLKGKRRITEAQLRLPNVVGLTCRARIPWMKPGGVWDMDWFIKHITMCNRTNRKLTFLCKSGEGFPLDDYVELTRRLSEWKSNVKFYGLHLTGMTPSGVSEELHWSKITEAIYGANCKLIDEFAVAFAGSTVKLIIAVTDKDPVGQQRIIDYAVSRLGVERVIVKQNALKASMQIGAPRNRLITKHGNPGFEQVCSWTDNPKRYGGTLLKSLNAAGVVTGGRRFYCGTYPPDLVPMSKIK